MKIFMITFFSLFSQLVLADDIRNISRDAAIACHGQFDMGSGIKDYQFEVAIIGEKNPQQSSLPIYFFVNGKKQIGFESMIEKQGKNLVFQMIMDGGHPTHALVVQNAAGVHFVQRSPYLGTIYTRRGSFVNFGKVYPVVCELYSDR